MAICSVSPSHHRISDAEERKSAGVWYALLLVELLRCAFALKKGDMVQDWEYKGSIATIASPWVTICAERWRDEQGRDLEYWRVERAHSLIVLPIVGDVIPLPLPQFRPGAGRATLDLPGGRVTPGRAPLTAAPGILERELGLNAAAIVDVQLLNEQGWLVNSSFSNQCLFGAVARIDPATHLDAVLLHRSYPHSRAGLRELLAELDCLQCRAVIYEYLAQTDLA